MGIEAVSELVAIVLALSLATERLLIAIRTPKLFSWLNKEKTDPAEDGFRRFILQLLTFVCAIFIAGWLADTSLIGGWNPFDSITIGSQAIPLLILALLATGGSSFWKNVLGYTKAIRDIRKTEVEAESKNVRRAKQLSESISRMADELTKMKTQPGI